MRGFLRAPPSEHWEHLVQVAWPSSCLDHLSPEWKMGSQSLLSLLPQVFPAMAELVGEEGSAGGGEGSPS